MNKYPELFNCNARKAKDKHEELMLSPSRHLFCLKAHVTFMDTPELQWHNLDCLVLLWTDLRISFKPPSLLSQVLCFRSALPSARDWCWWVLCWLARCFIMLWNNTLSRTLWGFCCCSCWAASRGIALSLQACPQAWEAKGDIAGWHSYLLIQCKGERGILFIVLYCFSCGYITCMTQISS